MKRAILAKRILPPFLLGPVLLLVAVLGGPPPADAAPRCLPEIDAEVPVLFEQPDLRGPIVVGSPWHGVEVPPEIEGAYVTPPRVLARVLLEHVGAADSKRARSVGAVTRWLLETVAEEIDALYRSLEQVSESGFVDSAAGREKPGQVGFVAGLVGSNFEATVDASIRQMEAYAALVAAATKSVDAFSNQQASSSGDELLVIAAELIDLDLLLREPGCED
jgi:hypothetical protein